MMWMPQRPRPKSWGPKSVSCRRTFPRWADFALSKIPRERLYPLLPILKIKNRILVDPTKSGETFGRGFPIFKMGQRSIFRYVQVSPDDFYIDITAEHIKRFLVKSLL
jgi:hypothetical protein